jgi:hypothetical protein
MSPDRAALTFQPLLRNISGLYDRVARLGAVQVPGKYGLVPSPLLLGFFRSK